jgi:hypothetical protein
MKKRLGFVYMLVMVLALGVLFTGCDNGTIQQVEFVPQKANAVSNVKVEKTTSGTSYNYVIVSWDAASNVTGYTIYVQQEGKKTAPSVPSFSSEHNDVTYSLTDGSPIPKAYPDIDKWSALGVSSERQGSGNSTFWIYHYTPGQKYRFGVRSDAPLFSTGFSAASDVVWSGYIEF